MKTNASSTMPRNLGHLATAALLGMTLVFSSPLQAQPEPHPPRPGEYGQIDQHLFPPDLIHHGREALGLTQDQIATLQEEVRSTQDKMGQLQEQLRKATERLEKLVAETHVDEEAALAQAEKLLSLEQQMKKLQLGLLIRIKNILTAEQQRKLRELKGRMKGVQAKMQEVQREVQRWMQEGLDPFFIHGMRAEFEEMMREGNFKEAEKVLDEALERLRANE